jgi:hypothetical protein
MNSMLKTRNIIATLLGRTLRGPTARSCPQSGVLWHQLCSVLMDELLTGLNECSYYPVEHADDIAVLTNGKFPQSFLHTVHIIKGMVT